MKHKNVATIAILMVIVFGLIVIFYPRIFSPTTNEPAAPAAAPAVGP